MEYMTELMTRDKAPQGCVADREDVDHALC
jgi:hypothetical protein